MMFVDSLKNIGRHLSDAIFGMPGLSDRQKEELQGRLDFLLSREVNILTVGGTGVGKSSTVNALFESNENSAHGAKVGIGAYSQTQSIDCYHLDKNLIIWDTPGLGESISADVLHARAINNKVREKNDQGEYLIDLVLVILDAGVRDYDSTFRVLKIVKEAIKDSSRVVVGLNRIDMLKQGEEWSYRLGRPKKELGPILLKKIENIKRRIKEECDLEVDPIPYCAGRTDDGWGGSKSYNVPQLFYKIVLAVPDDKRVAVMQKVKDDVYQGTTTTQRRVIRERAQDSFVGRGFGTIAKVAVSALCGGLLGCYITTAVCKYYRKPDNCYMLTTLRRYRDDYLLKTDEGRRLVQEYYETAPKIVAWIDRQPNKDKMYRMIYWRYLKPCVKLIKKRKFVECRDLYVDMVLNLKAMSQE